MGRKKIQYSKKILSTDLFQRKTDKDLDESERTMHLDPTPAEMISFEKSNLTNARMGKNLKGNHTSSSVHKGSNSPERLIANQITTLSEVDQRVNQIRNRFCRQGKTVNVTEIVKSLCDSYGVTHVRCIQASDSKYLFRNEEDIKAVKDILWLQRRVNAFIQAFVTFRSICTLHELHDAICKQEEKSTFDELKLGPFQRQTFVKECFSFPCDQETIPAITTLDVFKLLSRELRLSQERAAMMVKQRGKLSLVDFMEVIRKEYSFKTPFESGVIIKSMGLAVSVVSRAWRENRNFLFQAREDFTKQVTLEMKQYLDMLKQNFFEEASIKEKIANMDSLQAFKHLFGLLNNINEEVRKRFSGPEFLGIFYELCMKNFVIIQQNELMRTIFLLVLSLASMKTIESSDVDILKYLGFEHAMESNGVGAKGASVTKFNGKQQTVAKAKITDTVSRWLKKYHEIDLSILSKIESFVLNHIKRNCNSFEELGHGTFLKFICADKNLLELAQSTVVGQSTSSNIPSKQELQDFARQCGDVSAKDSILKALSVQFHIKNENDLKCISNILATPYTPNATDTTMLVYQQAYIYNTSVAELEPDSQPAQSVVQCAIKMINAVPFMESVEDWINWDCMFLHQLGPLKQFILSHFCQQKSDFTLMEISISHHIKIFKECTVEMFQNMLDLFDASKSQKCLFTARLVSTSIVSIISCYGHVQNTPMKLLGNHIQTRLLEESKRENKESNNVLRFCLHCFQFIPFDLLLTVFSELFLIPLQMLYGKEDVPQLLLDACKCQKERRILHALGRSLFDKVWTEGLHKEIEEAIQNMFNWRSELEASMNVTSETSDEDEEQKIKHGAGLTTEDNVITEVEIAAIINEPVKEEISNFEDANSLASDQFLDLVTSTEQGLTKTDETLNRDLAQCQQFIEAIRKEQFGIGVVFTSEEQRRLFETHREREGRSLHRLSKELYSRDSHFVLELIQNADDNSYNVDNFSLNETATVAFILEQDRITILNNEVGFSEANIRAVCDVGKSTKGAHRKGYIGQKGIGFKSVFRVTDCPEIHSNGFHVKFDASKGPNGYILPDWIGTQENGTEYDFDGIMYHWTTKIVLPLKEEMQHKNLTSRFHDVHPSLLMFLNRLQKIIIHDKVNDKMKIMQKSFVEDNIIKLAQNENSSLWFVVSNEIEINLHNEVKKSDISVAFPLDNSVSLDMDEQPVFAYLPLRSYGFKFIIQADFEVPSSREDIDKDSVWNQYILQNIPSVLIIAFYKFKSHPHFIGLEGLIHFFKFIEFEGNVIGVFKQVAKDVIKSLQKEKCLPVNEAQHENAESNTSKELTCEHQWRIPSSLIMTKSALVKLIPPDLLQKSLGLCYLDNEVSKRVGHAVLKSLGVNEVTIDNLIDIAKSFLLDLHKAKIHSTEPLKKMNASIGHWLCLLFNTLQDTCDCTEESLNKVKELQMFPLSDGKYVSLINTVVFLPLQDNSIDLQKQALNQPLQLIEQDLNILSRTLFEELNQMECAEVQRFLKDLGLKPILPRDLVYEHIIPTFKTGKWQEKDESLILAFVKYLHQQLENEIYNIDDVKNVLIIKTNQGFKQLCKDNIIYISHVYGNRINLEKILPSCGWLLVSREYATGCSEKELQSWYNFFLELGMQSFATLCQKKKTFHKSDLVGTIWEKTSEEWPETEDGNYVIEDLECSELTSLLKSQKKEEMCSFSLLLNEYWDQEFKKYDLSRPTCAVEDTKGVKIVTTYSSFVLQMRLSPWLPSTTRQVHKSIDLYIRSHDILELLSDNANYLDPRITNKDFITTLRVQRDITFETFIKEFSTWIAKPSFATSREHILKVYKYLRNHSTEIVSLLDKPFIFLPKKQNYENSGIIEGQFHKVAKVSWRDPSGIFRKIDSVSTRKILQDFFPKTFQEFFLNVVGVDEYPSGEEYLRLITNITATVTVLPNKEKCFEIFMLMAVLAEIFLHEDALNVIDKIGYPHELLHKYKLYDNFKDYFLPGSLTNLKNAMINDKAIFPTMANVFASLEQAPILVFNPELARIYKNKSAVPMIFADDVYSILKERQEFISDANSLFLKVLVFFKVCKLPTLKELYIEPEVITEQLDSGCAYWEKVLHDITPITQRYIASLLPALYKEKQTKIFVSDSEQQCTFSEYIKNSSFFSAQKLEVIYHLKERDDVNIKLEKASNVDLTNSKAMIYINKTAADSKDCYEKILLEILRLFTDDEGERESLLDFITTYNDVQGKDSYLRRKKIVKIKDGEMWSYPEPRFKEMVKPETIKTQTPEVPGTSSTEKRLTCWPPQKPGMGLGFVVKPESIKEDERKILEKWGSPDVFSNITETASNEVVNEKGKTTQLVKDKHRPIEHTEEKLKENKPPIDVVLDKKEQTTQPLPAKCRPGEHVKGKIKEEKSEQSKRPMEQKIISQETSQVFLTKETKHSQSSVEIVKAEIELGSNDEETKSSFNAETKPTFNPDKYITTCLDVEMEDLPVDQNYVDILTQFSKTETDPNEFTKLIGKIGEEIIYKYLRGQYEAKNVAVEWINSNDEAGQPYDIKITHPDGKVVYIEVKSTGGHEKKEFEISSQQLKFALEQGSNFHLYRISGLTSKSKLTRLVDLSMYMDQKTVKLYMIV